MVKRALHHLYLRANANWSTANDLAKSGGLVAVENET